MNVRAVLGDDDQLAVLKDELLYAHPQVVEDAGRGLRWTSDAAALQTPAPPAPQYAPPPVGQADDHPPVTSPPTARHSAFMFVHVSAQLYFGSFHHGK